MEFALLGWPPEGPTLRLDFRSFGYAGKFVMSNTGKAVARADGTVGPPADADSYPAVDDDAFERDVLAAAAFNEDRTDPGVLWLRYLTVHHHHRGEGIGARLAAFVAERADGRGYRRQRIAVNNPFAYEALYKAGFVFTGRTTGLAEVVLERPGERDDATYQAGLDLFRERDLSAAEEAFLADREGEGTPALVPGRPPDGGNGTSRTTTDGDGAGTTGADGEGTRATGADWDRAGTTSGDPPSADGDSGG